MRDPKIVEVIAFGLGDDIHPPCLVMERMQETLYDFLGVQGFDLPLMSKVTIAQDVCEVRLIFVRVYECMRVAPFRCRDALCGATNKRVALIPRHSLDTFILNVKSYDIQCTVHGIGYTSMVSNNNTVGISLIVFLTTGGIFIFQLVPGQSVLGSITRARRLHLDQVQALTDIKRKTSAQPCGT